MSKIVDLLPMIKGEIIELDIGDDYEELISSDSTKKMNTILYGKVINIIDDFMILDCIHIDENSTEVKFGNILYINTWHIKAFTKLKSNGSLSDAYLSSEDSLKIKRLLKFDE